MTRISYAERDRIFGKPCTSQNLATVTTPWGIRCRVHKLVLPVFEDACAHACAEVVEWKPQRIDSYACRDVRGSTAKSLHAYGLAWDFFATPPNVPPPGGVWTPDNGLPTAFARCFTERGFTWGATFTRKDAPHIEWAGGKPGKLASSPPSAPRPLTLTHTDSYEVDMVVNAYQLVIATDANGCGWDRVPFNRSRIIGHTGPGLRPASDGRYLVGKVGFAEEGTDTIVSVAEWAPNATCIVRLSVSN